MKNAHLADVIKKRCNRMHSTSDAIPGQFGPDDIHDLRVDYKKLRAFIRLLQFESGSSKRLSVPGELKNVYQSGALVRDMQLFLPLLKSHERNLTQYKAARERDLFSAKEQLVEAIEAASYKKAERKMLQDLPDELHEETVRKFVHKNISGIQIIRLALEDDDHLHQVRKNLKDIVFNIRVFRDDWNIPFPVKAWKSEDDLSDLASSLGDYNDKCIAVSYLSDRYLANLPSEEQQVIHCLREQWENEKEIQKQEMMRRVRQLEVVSDF